MTDGLHVRVIRERHDRLELDGHKPRETEDVVSFRHARVRETSEMMLAARTIGFQWLR